MPNPVKGALRRRIVPSVPLALKLEDDSGASFTRDFRLSFDFNAFALINERTGYSVVDGSVWKHLDERVVGVMLWAAVLAHSPEYGDEEGLAVIRSYIDAGNAELVTESLFDAYAAGLPAEKKAALLEAKNKLVHGQDPTQAPGNVMPAPLPPPGSNTGLLQDSISG
jgi:hypothetical protein